MVDGLDTQKYPWLYKEEKLYLISKWFLFFFSSKPFLCLEKQTFFKLMFILVFIWIIFLPNFIP